MTTQKMTVDDLAFLIEKLESDCSPLQRYRELTVNCIQSIQESFARGFTGEGLVHVDVDWPFFENYGIYKMRIMDNGTGMSGADLQRYINSLSSSGRSQSLSENFGIGAKITAGVANPVGLVYTSWVDGQGVMAHLWKDEERRYYGLKQIELPDGTFTTTPPVDDALRPNDIIQDHGTAVTMLGRTFEENTMLPDGQPSKFLTKYLNSKFYKFPERIKVTVREFNHSDPSDWPTDPEYKGMGVPGGSQKKTIHGMKHYLENFSDSFGIVQLTDAKVHWHIIKRGSDDRPYNSGGIWETSAHIASMYQDELYDWTVGRSALPRLREFGIIFGTERMVVYVEPDPNHLSLAPNTARSNLLTEGRVLPWDRWAAEFRQSLPSEIKTMMDEITATQEGTDHRDAIRRRLREIRDLMKVSRYRRNAQGRVLVDGALPGGASRTGGGKGTGSGSHGGQGAGSGNLYGAYISKGGDPATPIASRINEPEVRWVSVTDHTRSAGDDLEDKAARFLPEQNLIQANADFRVFQDMTRDLQERYSHTDHATGQIKNTVEEWFAQQLVEAVLGVQSLQGSPEWNDDLVAEALSTTSLTTAVMPRYSTYSMIKRSLGGRIGAGRVSEAAPVDNSPAVETIAT